ncbi:hypothetical protein HDV00_007631 [Rhizophlyctis rosea]|nr:hypothetical protein HDV00_007631 [Rhizophlyctis rosea]
MAETLSTGEAEQMLLYRVVDEIDAACAILQAYVQPTRNEANETETRGHSGSGTGFNSEKVINKEDDEEGANRQRERWDADLQRREKETTAKAVAEKKFDEQMTNHLAKLGRLLAQTEGCSVDLTVTLRRNWDATNWFTLVKSAFYTNPAIRNVLMRMEIYSTLSEFFIKLLVTESFLFAPAIDVSIIEGLRQVAFKATVMRPHLVGAEEVAFVDSIQESWDALCREMEVSGLEYESKPQQSSSSPYIRLMSNFTVVEVYGTLNNPGSLSRKAVLAIMKERADMPDVLPCHEEASIFAVVHEEDIGVLQLLMTARGETPHAHGMYQFDVRYGEDFPDQVPECRYVNKTALNNIKHNILNLIREPPKHFERAWGEWASEDARWDGTDVKDPIFYVNAVYDKCKREMGGGAGARNIDMDKVVVRRTEVSPHSGWGKLIDELKHELEGLSGYLADQL